MKKLKTKNAIKQSGLSQAIRYIVSLERGEGDTIVDIEKYWGDATVHYIHEKIMSAKAVGDLELS